MFKKAERKQTKLKLAITGPTGSGKTFSALRLAHGMGGKVAFIDTENGSASLYSEMKEGPLVGFEFDVMDMTPPFTTEKYIDAINYAEKNGYATIIIDSLTHAWAGEGGLLEQKAMLDARPNSNHWTNWGPIDKKDNALKNAFLHSSCHIIACMRSKMEYAQSENNGKKKIDKVGMAPIQRDGLSYEFSIVFDAGMDHNVEVSKDRTHLFDNNTVFKVTEDTGKLLIDWLNAGKEVDFTKPAPPKPQTGYTGDPAEYIATLGKSKGKKLKEISPESLDDSLGWMVKNIANPNPSQQEFYNQVEKYLISINFYPPKGEDNPQIN